MPKKIIDLHIHTTCSDGIDTPEEIVEECLRDDYMAFSITDHDTVDGVVRGIEASRGKPIEFVPGIELSSLEDMYDIHILGYFIDYSRPDFLKRISFFKEKRRDRAEEIVRNLNRLGLDLQIDTVLRMAHGSPIGRPHIAEALVSEELVDTYNEAFIRYIGDQGPAYVPKYEVTPHEAIELITSSGGVAVLAHPAVNNRDELIPELVEYGLRGIEAFHPLHAAEKQLYYEKLAKKYGIIVTGGSDWHGKNRSRYYKNLHRHSRTLQESLRRMKDIARGVDPRNLSHI